jgi:TIR domain
VPGCLYAARLSEICFSCFRKFRGKGILKFVNLYKHIALGYQKIFFSYSRVDGEKAALKLAGDLRKLGANVWIDQLDIKAGTIWDEEIERTLEKSDCILFIATPKSTSSNNVLNEVYYALEENKQVIPVIFENCKIPFRLKRLQYIDFTGDYDSALDRLAEALNLKGNLSIVEEEPFPEQESTEVDDGNKGFDDNNYGKQLKDALHWSRVSALNTISGYEEYLDAYPNGKFRDRALQLIDELNQIETGAAALNVKSKQHVHSSGERQRSAQERKPGKRTIVKVIGIGAAVILLAIVAKTFFFTNRYKTGNDTSNYSLLTPGDSVAKAEESSSLGEQPLSEDDKTGSHTTEMPAKPEPISDNGGSPITKDNSNSYPETPAVPDFDETINEKIVGSWYEADNEPVDGLTAVMTQTYYRNGLFESAVTYKNINGVVMYILTYKGIWSVKNGYMYEEVTASSDPQMLAVGYNQTTQITSINHQTVGYIDTKGIQRKMYRL